MPVVENSLGGYAFVPMSSFASTGVAALRGMTIERAVLPVPRPLPEGYDVIRGYLARLGRPMSALCGVELRMPTVLELQPFQAFNKSYLAQLDAWGVLLNGTCPLARTNVVPTGNTLRTQAVAAFSYTMPAADATPAFVFSGLPELPDGSTYPQGTVRRGETSEAALDEKTRCTVDIMLARARALDVTWDAATSVHLYTKRPLAAPLQHIVRERLGVAPAHGIIWHDSLPPVVELELEIDIRRYRREVMLAGD